MVVEARRPGTRAALGTPLAARLYGAAVLRDAVSDDDGNVTRFVWLARAEDAPAPPGGRPRKTSVVWWGEGDGRRAGSSAACRSSRSAG